MARSGSSNLSDTFPDALPIVGKENSIRIRDVRVVLGVSVPERQVKRSIRCLPRTEFRLGETASETSFSSTIRTKVPVIGEYNVGVRDHGKPVAVVTFRVPPVPDQGRVVLDPGGRSIVE